MLGLPGCVGQDILVLACQALLVIRRWGGRDNGRGANDVKATLIISLNSGWS